LFRFIKRRVQERAKTNHSHPKAIIPVPGVNPGRLKIVPGNFGSDDMLAQGEGSLPDIIVLILFLFGQNTGTRDELGEVLLRPMQQHVGKAVRAWRKQLFWPLFLLTTIGSGEAQIGSNSDPGKPLVNHPVAGAKAAKPSR
jgi:hypothetical protein